jgi:chromosome segregation ATPase
MMLSNLYYGGGFTEEDIKQYSMSDKHYPELSNDHDESIHVQPYADMIDKLTYVQKADFAKHALDLERDLTTYKKMFEEVSRERNAWISEYRAARQELERLKEKVSALNRTEERLESDLKEAIDIMEAIYANVDQYHLDFAFHGGECYDKLKDYLGI